jgi:hypothetical protein
MTAFSSATLGWVLSSAGETIAIGQTTEQIPHRVQRSISTIMVSIKYHPLWLLLLTESDSCRHTVLGFTRSASFFAGFKA